MLTKRRSSVVPPALLLAGLNAYNLWNEHWEHWSHLPPLEERVEYPYQNIRTRNFQWGDGDKVCVYTKLSMPSTFSTLKFTDANDPRHQTIL